LLSVIECRINDLGEEFRNRPEPLRLMFIGPIERLSEHELSRVGVVTNIQPVADAAIWTGVRRQLDHAADDN